MYCIYTYGISAMAKMACRQPTPSHCGQAPPATVVRSSTFQISQNAEIFTGESHDLSRIHKIWCKITMRLCYTRRLKSNCSLILKAKYDTLRSLTYFTRVLCFGITHTFSHISALILCVIVCLIRHAEFSIRNGISADLSMDESWRH